MKLHTVEQEWNECKLVIGGGGSFEARFCFSPSSVANINTNDIFCHNLINDVIHLNNT